MGKRRVVITGMGTVSPFGPGVKCLWEHLLGGDSAVRIVPEMQKLGGLRSSIAALVPAVDASVIPRKKRRFMSPMSVYSTIAALEATAMAGLSEDRITDRGTGLCLASTMGSTSESEAFFQELNRSGSIENIKSTMFFKTMNHSCAANTAQALGITGRIISPSAACASSNLAVGLAFEMIAAGNQNMMICGGSDEHHCLAPAVFDIMNAASCQYNNDPQQTPRPFDINRDGVVCAEGAGILILEEMEYARRRNADILAEIIGFATFSAPENIANPDSQTIADCMECSMNQAGVHAEEVDYVNAHATATIQGDIAEAQAIGAVMGDKAPVSSLKGHLGHTMAASGAMELIASIQMMHYNILIPTRNLVTPDPECNVIDFIIMPRKIEINIILKNSFALGGINSALLIRRDRND
ncbi:MAG: 3-oxoacyl-ACP synthase [Planctomycetes bacterium B3_Pla]|nr:MAG: 3-oxoacyl-ACP synthase [Planctomycetes bacterium B3_Pla]